MATRGVEIGWHAIREGSPLAGRSLAEANIRSVSGASVVALVRDREVIANPKSSLRFEVGDMVGLIGEAEELDSAHQLMIPLEA